MRAHVLTAAAAMEAFASTCEISSVTCLDAPHFFVMSFALHILALLRVQAARARSVGRRFGRSVVAVALVDPVVPVARFCEHFGRSVARSPSASCIVGSSGRWVCWSLSFWGGWVARSIGRSDARTIGHLVARSPGRPVARSLGLSVA